MTLTILGAFALFVGLVYYYGRKAGVDRVRNAQWSEQAQMLEKQADARRKPVTADNVDERMRDGRF